MYEFLQYAGVIAGILVILVLLFYPQRHNSANWLLGLSILSLWYAMIMAILYETNYILVYPHFSRTGNFFAFFTIPFFYLFTRFIFYRDKKIKRYDWILFLPALFYLIDFFPYFLISAEEKLEIIRAEQMNLGHFAFSEGWLTSSWFQFYARQFWSLVILLMTFRLIWINRVIFHRSFRGANRDILILIVAIGVFYAVSFIPGFMKLFKAGSAYNIEFQNTTIALTHILLGLFLAFHPKYWYGFFWENELVKSPVKKSEGKENTDFRGLNDTFAQLEDFMKSKKPFLNSGYTINDLSNDSGIPVYKISPAVNSGFNTNFNQWLNYHRVKEFEELVKKGETHQLTLDALSGKCGFSNRSSFNTAFKKFNGQTPSAFIKSQNGI